MTTTPTTDLADLVRTHLAAHPGDSPLDVAAAIRAQGHQFQSFQVHGAYTKIRPIPTLATVDEAAALLAKLAESHDWVAVFWDRGWGDSGQTAEITIIVGGNGDMPLAHLTPDVYNELKRQKIVAANSYGGYKKRRLHDYKMPAPAEKTGPTSNDIAEQVIRKLMHDLADQPIRAEFYRGTEGRPVRVVYETATTPAYEGTWFVLMYPGHSDVAISAQEPTVLGPDIIGRGVADSLAYPRTDGGEVDTDALASDEFRAQLAAAVEEKLAVIAERRTAVKA